MPLDGTQRCLPWHTSLMGCPIKRWHVIIIARDDTAIVPFEGSIKTVYMILPSYIYIHRIATRKPRWLLSSVISLRLSIPLQSVYQPGDLQYGSYKLYSSAVQGYSLSLSLFVNLCNFSSLSDTMEHNRLFIMAQLYTTYKERFIWTNKDLFQYEYHKCSPIIYPRYRCCFFN